MNGDLKMKSVVFLLLSAVALAFPAFAGSERDFEATAFQYDAAAADHVTTKKFESRIKIAEQGAVRIITISSYITGKSDPDVIIRVVSSSTSAANMIYNGKMDLIAEYPTGEILNQYLLSFKGGDDKRIVAGKWYMDVDNLMSDFSVSDPNGVLVYKETVVYRAKKPAKK
ncbi:MAG: hypothetical protein HY280_03580 [Nitrospinae bacterium]|nr:hypothetical protein [Nitrospinota bacterium]